MNTTAVQYRARPQPGFEHGAAELDAAGCELQCDAMWFPDEQQARTWAIARRWKRYALKQAFGMEAPANG
jgi:hypothetical protein